MLRIGDEASVGSLQVTKLTFSDNSELVTSQVASGNGTYYMKAGITGNYNIGTFQQPQVSVINKVVDMHERFNITINPNFGDWDNTNNSWICPAEGIYKIIGSLNIKQIAGQDKLRKAFVKIAKVGADGGLIRLLNKGGLDNWVETYSEGHEWSVDCSVMERIYTGDRIALLIDWRVDSGAQGVQILGGVSNTQPDATFLTVERIANLS